MVAMEKIPSGKLVLNQLVEPPNHARNRGCWGLNLCDLLICTERCTSNVSGTINTKKGNTRHLNTNKKDSGLPKTNANREMHSQTTSVFRLEVLPYIIIIANSWLKKRKAHKTVRRFVLNVQGAIKLYSCETEDPHFPLTRRLISTSKNFTLTWSGANWLRPIWRTNVIYSPYLNRWEGAT